MNTNEQVPQCGCASALYSREISHRTANVLQNVMAAVGMCRRGDPGHLDEAMTRLSAAASLHRLLAAGGSGYADLSLTLPDACSAAVAVAAAGPGVLLHVDCASTVVDAATVRPMLMIAAELVGNSVKHAFPQGSGTILVVVTTNAVETRLLVEDDGRCRGWSRDGGEGREIVDGLARAIGGRVTRTATPAGSSRVVVTMPSVAAAARPEAGHA